MKKNYKKIIKLVIASTVMLLTACVSSATATAPVYNGFTVVSVNVDGKEVQGDVPAVNFYGRTVVPIRFVSEALGAKVEWNSETNTASITTPKQTISAPNNAQTSDQANISQKKYDDDIAKLKLYSRISNAYMQINDLAKQVMNISNLYGDVIDNVEEPDAISLLANAQASINSLKNDLIPSTQKDILALKQTVTSQGIDISDVDSLFNNLTSALNMYSSGYTIISTYIKTNDDSILDTYQSQETNAFNLAKQTMDSSFARFGEFYGKIQNF
ncbi:copper amine oxidase N-terminal domain-containing protein [Paenibacillus planticolens]|uniref:Copper amine oxidase-like N-terminal domain-containing protein n=1 Tax=Paenibacillus planticolens TaxID=2654976 RepID=A0ABX1ZKQ6_9BACL|nr:copper amine oxidase N-terminal domain-containing protein [Paenibacillus planticolens]NOU99436.1 hypothetical protein [Paenibacillus planticolens]